MANKKLCILTSGGLDSTIAWYYALAHGYKEGEIIALWVDLNHPYAWKEKKALDNLPFKVDRLSCPTIAEKWGNVPTIHQQIIPGRNLLLATIAASIGADRIWMGALAGEMHQFMRDKTHEFFHLSSGLFTFIFKDSREEVIVETPFKDMTKAQVVAWALTRGISVQTLSDTVSCYHETHQRCGICSTCFKRWIAFTLSGVEEEHANCPWTSEEALKLIENVIKAALSDDFSHYSPRRVIETIEAMSTVRVLTTIETEAADHARIRKTLE